jgi:hypothetical protein
LGARLIFSKKFGFFCGKDGFNHLAFAFSEAIGVGSLAGCEKISSSGEFSVNLVLCVVGPVVDH